MDKATRADGVPHAAVGSPLAADAAVGGTTGPSSRSAADQSPETPAKGNPSKSREHFRWDGYHHQPHVDLTKWQKLWVGKNDVASILALVARGLPHVGDVVKGYRRLLAADAAPQAVRPRQIGVAISPTSADISRYADSLADLGVRSTLIRVPCWQPQPVLRLRDRLMELRRDGMSFCFALLQDRQAVTDSGRWTSFVTEVTETLAELEPTIQVGHAPNRKKWGVWHPDEYLRMLDVIKTLRERHPACRFIGPSVIDFEYHCTLGFLSARRECDFDGISALLYVDRRGSPDARQYRHFDLWRKVLLLKALIAASPHPEVPVYLTEFNWPLKGSGRHCPAGAAVATDEERQAAYLVAYYLTVLAAGGVEKAFWWQLVARGYGLRDEDEAWAPRASYAALRNLVARISGATVQRLEGRDAGLRGFRIERDGRTTVVAYDIGSGRPLDLGGASVSLSGVDGRELPVLGATLGVMPTYIEVDGKDASTVLGAVGLAPETRVARA